MKSIVHVNQHHIRKNHKNQSNLPVITIKQGGKTNYAWGVEFTGPCKLEYHENNPLSCGARVWISTEDLNYKLGEDYHVLTYRNSKVDDVKFEVLNVTNATDVEISELIKTTQEEISLLLSVIQSLDNNE